MPSDHHSDHRRLGRELDLFTTTPIVGAGLPLWLPDGAVIRAELERLVAEQARRDGCRRVYTPVLGKRELYERSGHWAKFHEDMFPPMRVGGEEFVLRPTNCPHHIQVYANGQHSFRELPLRLAEVGAMFRSELSGVLSGLSRVREIHLDDVHVFCTADQVHDELVRAVQAARRCHRLLGIEVAYFRLSRRGDAGRYLGDDAGWQQAEASLVAALDELGLSYVDAPGEAAFYAPKIDMQVVDPAGREETLSTVQLDFVQPERFGLNYIGPDGGRHRPVMIHRGLLSSMERLVANLIERYDGAFPPWLAPTQIAILPVTEAHLPAASALADRLLAADLRPVVAAPDETLGARIRHHRDSRTPYLAILGDREVSEDRVTLRLRDQRQLPDLTVPDLLSELARVTTTRALDLGFTQQPAAGGGGRRGGR
jgi:threonyl-tRNA synthetase